MIPNWRYIRHQLQWRRSSTPSCTPSSISCLFVPGLNNNISVFDELSLLFNAQNIECCLFMLPGHQSLSPADNLDQIWKESLEQAFEQFNHQAQATTKIFIGLSLSALVASQLANLSLVFQRQILFAPAFKLHKTHFVLNMLTGLFKFKLPSFAPKKIRAHAYLTSNYYRGLFKLLAQFNAAPVFKLPTLIVMNNRDELVSLKGIERLANDHQHIRILLIPTKSYPHHWVVSAENYTKENWDILTAKLLASLVAFK